MVDVKQVTAVRHRICSLILHAVYMAIMLFGAFVVGRDYAVYAEKLGSSTVFGYLALLALLTPIILSKWGITGRSHGAE